MTFRRWRPLAVGAAAALMLGACGGSAPPSPSTGVRAPATTAPAEATTGYRAGAGLTLAVGAEPASWNCDAAATVRSSCLAAIDAVWPSVYRLDATGTPQLDTSFVSSATVTSMSPQTVVYRINPKASWSDGVPITAADFAYTWQAQSGSTAYHDVGGAAFTPDTTTGYADIASVAGAPGDAETVTVTFAHPDPEWTELFGSGHPILPAHIAERVGFDHGFTDPVADLVSGGPFVVTDYRPGESLTLVRNPRYWGATAPLGSVTLRFTTSADQYPPALHNGTVGAAEITGDAGSLVSSDVLDALDRLSGVTVKATPSTTYQLLAMNEANPVLADPAVRRAISVALSRTALAKAVAGTDDASVGPLGNRFAVPGGDGYSDNTPNDAGAGDLDQARQDLEADGYTATPGAALTRAGQAVTLRLTAESGQPALQAEEQLIIAALGQLGIVVTETDSPDVGATLAGGAWDLALTTADAVPFASQVVASYTAGDPADVAHVNVAKINALAAQVATTFDAAHRQALLGQIDQALWAAAVDLPLFQLPSVFAYRAGLGGATASAGAEGPTATLATWGITASS